MSMLNVPDNPDVAAALVTGYPAGVPDENQDNAENRRTFAEEHIKDFIDWVLAGDQEAVNNFVSEHGWLYKSWLN